MTDDVAWGGNTSRNGNNLMMESPLDHQCVPKIGEIWYLRKTYQLLLISIANFLDSYNLSEFHIIGITFKVEVSFFFFSLNYFIKFKFMFLNYAKEISFFFF